MVLLENDGRFEFYYSMEKPMEAAPEGWAAGETFKFANCP